VRDVAEAQRVAEERETREQHEQRTRHDEEPREEPERRQAVDLAVVVDVRLHRHHERLVVREPGRDLPEDRGIDVRLLQHRAEAVLHRSRHPAEHRDEPTQWAEHVVVVHRRRRDLIRLHDRPEAVEHPLSGGRLRRERDRKRRDHEREPDHEHGAPEHLRFHP
jgi:hypothetical protein